MTQATLSTLHQALALQKSGDFFGAEQAYRAILSQDPNNAMAYHLLGILLTQVGQASEAENCIARSIELAPNDALALNNLANAQKCLGKFAASVESCTKALAIRPNYSMALCSRANALNELKLTHLALADLDVVLRQEPHHVQALVCKTRVLLDANCPADALHVVKGALDLEPENCDALVCASAALILLKRAEESLPYLRIVLNQEPKHKTAYGWLLKAMLVDCNWSNLESIVKNTHNSIIYHDAVVSPLTLISCIDEPDLHLLTATKINGSLQPTDTQFTFSIDGKNKIKVAYISSDFCNHPVAHHIVEVIELHSRDKFEILGISIGPNDNSSIRNRLISAFDSFTDLTHLSDNEVANFIKKNNIHVAVDLNGLTQLARPGIFKHKPAPIVINYLGFPSSVGNSSHDYIIGDKIVTPFNHSHYFTESIVQLPGSFMPVDRNWIDGDEIVSRDFENLPTDAFVFASFNSHHKISPQIFDIWMRLLKKIDGSILWLQGGTESSCNNLRSEAKTRGVSAERLIFSEHATIARHYARHQLADLFLDTFPYNAHSTAAFALRAGLPIVTLQGKCFASRVSSSLLNAVELFDLVSHDYSSYEEKALMLAKKPDLLSEIKCKLRNKSINFDLFNTPKFVLGLEEAYQIMLETKNKGVKAQSFAVSSQTLQTP